MKKRIIWLLVSSLMVLLILSGCGVPQEDYDAVVAQKATAEAKTLSLQGEVDEAESQIETLENALATVESALTTTHSELEATESELESVKSELQSLRSQLSEGESEPAPSPTTPSPTMASLLYNNVEYGFSVDYPADWDFEEGILGMMVMFVGPFDEEMGFTMNMSIICEELPSFPKLTLEDYVKLAQMQVRQILTNYEKLDEYSTTIDGYAATFYSIASTYDGVTSKQAQVLFIREDIAYAITFTATPETYDEYLDCLQLVMSSFKFE